MDVGNRVVVKTMPDRETLEAFLAGMSGATEVIFDVEKGEFEWVAR